MSDVLDMPMAALARGGMAAAVKAIEANTDRNYQSAVELLVKAAAETPNVTLAAVLRDEGIHCLEQIDADLRTLDRAETAKRAAYAQAAARDDDRVTPFGNVMLDQGANVGAWLHDPVVSENRYRAARSYAEKYRHPQTGRQAWDADDREAIDVGCDLLATLERPHKLAANLAPAQRLDRQLDRAWTAGSDPGERVRLLDAAVSAHREELRLLDQAAPDRVRLHGVKLLDQGDGPSGEHQALGDRVWREMEAAGELPTAANFMRRVDAHLAAR
jgi:hypothetical protein